MERLSDYHCMSRLRHSEVFNQPAPKKELARAETLEAYSKVWFETICRPPGRSNGNRLISLEQTEDLSLHYVYAHNYGFRYMTEHPSSNKMNAADLCLWLSELLANAYTICSPPVAIQTFKNDGGGRVEIEVVTELGVKVIIAIMKLMLVYETLVLWMTEDRIGHINWIANGVLQYTQDNPEFTDAAVRAHIDQLTNNNNVVKTTVLAVTKYFKTFNEIIAEFIELKYSESDKTEAKVEEHNVELNWLQEETAYDVLVSQKWEVTISNILTKVDAAKTSASNALQNAPFFDTIEVGQSELIKTLLSLNIAFSNNNLDTANELITRNKIQGTALTPEEALNKISAEEYTNLWVSNIEALARVDEDNGGAEDDVVETVGGAEDEVVETGNAENVIVQESKEIVGTMETYQRSLFGFVSEHYTIKTTIDDMNFCLYLIGLFKYGMFNVKKMDAAYPDLHKNLRLALLKSYNYMLIYRAGSTSKKEYVLQLPDEYNVSFIDYKNMYYVIIFHNTERYFIQEMSVFRMALLELNANVYDYMVHRSGNYNPSHEF